MAAGIVLERVMELPRSFCYLPVLVLPLGLFRFDQMSGVVDGEGAEFVGL
ncbi:MAG: hypothetical protein ACK5H2_00130 [Beutenbergiaceae bacterium]